MKVRFATKKIKNQLLIGVVEGEKYDLKDDKGQNSNDLGKFSYRFYDSDLFIYNSKHLPFRQISVN